MRLPKCRQNSHDFSYKAVVLRECPSSMVVGVDRVTFYSFWPFPSIFSHFSFHLLLKAEAARQGGAMHGYTDPFRM